MAATTTTAAMVEATTVLRPASCPRTSMASTPGRTGTAATTPGMAGMAGMAGRGTMRPSSGTGSG